MAGGGLTTLPVPDDMFDEHTFAGGGIVAFAKGDEVSARARAKQQVEAYYGKPISDAEFDLLINATHAESSGKSSPEEQAMIMGSVLNRAKAKDTSIKSVLYAPNQFQSVTGTSKNNHAPSAQFEKGPSDKRAADIFDAATLLPRVSPKQVDFTSANRKAYGPGTNVGYLDKLAANGTQVAGSMFNTGLMPANVAGTPNVQMARNEPPAPTAGQIAQSVLPGIPSAQAAAPRDVQTSTLEPSRADAALAALSALNPIGTAQAAEIPKAQPPTAAPYKDPFSKAPLFKMYTPSSISPDADMSRAGRYAATGLMDIGGGIANIPLLMRNLGAEVGNRTANFFTKPVGPDVAPEAPRTPGKLPVDRTASGHPYIMGSDPAREAALLGKPPAAPVVPPAPAPAPAPAKETAEEAMARILAANKKENFWNTMAQAGFGMMAGTSPNALTNIGAGLSAALPGMSAANRADQEMALKQQELAQTGSYQNKMLEAQQNTDTRVTIENYFQQLKAQDAAAGKHTPDVILRGIATQRAQEGRNPYASLSAMGGVSTALIKAQQDLQMLTQSGAPADQIAAAQATVANLQRSQGTLSGVGGGGLGGANLVQAADYFQ
jgi:hypothetical protein